MRNRSLHIIGQKGKGILDLYNISAQKQKKKVDIGVKKSPGKGPGREVISEIVSSA